MIFSILIPSKNGEKDIDGCINSVLDQKFDSFELIIGDNNNNEKFKNIISKYNKHENIKIISHKTDVPVTDNWQSCLDVSTGDYIIMLGDDDGLLPNSLEDIFSVIKDNNYPECLSLNGIGFYNKGSLSKINSSAYSKLFFDYKKKGVDEGVLSKKDRLNIVKKMFNFDNRLPLNMQPHIVSRKALKRLKKNLYQPPFPDHYALNSLLLTAESWVVSYKKVVAVGITSNSFGHFYFNEKTSDGIKYLGHEMDFSNSVPGSILNTCMMMWLMNIKTDYANYLNSVKIPRAAYVQRQFYYILSQYFKKNIKFGLVLKFFYNLKFRDKLRLMTILFKFNMMYRGLLKIFSGDISNMILLKEDIDIYSFTRSKNFK